MASVGGFINSLRGKSNAAQDDTNYPVQKSPEEWVELLNVSSNSMSLAGFRFSKGVSFVLPSITLEPGGFLVVAADSARFHEIHPDVTNAVGGWIGTLANTDENLELSDAQGAVVNQVHYSSEGDWAERERGGGPQLVGSITRSGGQAKARVSLEAARQMAPKVDWSSYRAPVTVMTRALSFSR